MTSATARDIRSEAESHRMHRDWLAAIRDRQSAIEIRARAEALRWTVRDAQGVREEGR